jgi:hypothetical protein
MSGTLQTRTSNSHGSEMLILTLGIIARTPCRFVWTQGLLRVNLMAEG